MKKTTIILLVLLGILSGCGKKSESPSKKTNSMICTYQTTGFDETSTYEFQDDEVKKIFYTKTVNVELRGDPMSDYEWPAEYRKEKYNEIDGVVYSYSIDGDVITIDFTIDFSIANLELVLDIVDEVHDEWVNASYLSIELIKENTIDTCN